MGCARCALVKDPGPDVSAQTLAPRKKTEPGAPDRERPPETERPRPLTGGAVMSGISRTSVAITGAATTILVARLLGPSGAGAYAVALTLILLLNVIATLGIEHGIAYYVSSGRWEAGSAFRDSQRLALVCGVLGAGLGLLARIAVPAVFHGLSPAVTLVAALALPFLLSWFYGSYVALAIDRYERFVLPAAIQSALGLCLVAVLAAVDGVPGAVIGITGAHAITAVAMLIASRKTFGSPRRRNTRGDRARLLRAVSFGLKGYAANALQFVNLRFDLLILNAVAAGAAVGHYAVAVSVTSVMWLLPQALSDVLFPRVASLSGHSKDGGEMLRFAEAKTLRHTVLVTLAVAVVLAIALVALVVPVYGAAFGQSTELGLILLPGVAMFGIANPMWATISGRGRPGLLLAGALVVTPVTVALYIVLIPALHGPGAALASSLSYAMTFAVALVCYRRVTGTNPLWLMLPTSAELADYRALVPALRTRLAQLHRPTPTARPAALRGSQTPAPPSSTSS